MLERIRIWDSKDGFVHYELTATDGTIEAHCAMPVNEWIALRNKQIHSYPGNVSISLLTDYLAVADDLLS